jgi:hypothetical protein
MDIGKVKEVLTRAARSIPAGIPYGGSVYSQYLSQLSSKEQIEFYKVLVEIMRTSEDQLNALREDLGNIGISNKEQVGQIAGLLKEIIENEKRKTLKTCFVQANDELKAEINKNFLREFDGPNTDYLQLLSDDLRKLFFKSFNKSNHTNEYNRFCIVGHEGVGKTFNSLLIGKRLTQEGYSVYYCEDARDANLSKGLISEIMDSFDEHFVFIVDNCQSDEIKTSEIVKRTTKAGGYAGKPRFVFLTRPLDRDDMKDIFGEATKILEFKKRYVNFDYLVQLFFKMISRSEMLDNFLSSLEQYDLSKTLFKYRNMAFWNDFFRFMRDGFEKGDVTIEEREFYERANRFLRKDEPYLIESKDVLAKLLPYFMNGISILRDYAKEYLQISDAQIRKLGEEKVISLKEQDWDNKNWQNDTAMFIVSKLHPTKAKIVAALLKKYEGTEIDTVSAIIDYAERYYENFYYIITSFYESETLKELCKSDRFTSILKIYLKKRHLGKHLDRVIRTFAKLEPQLKDKLIDDEIISSLVEELNDKKPYLVSKLYLFIAMYKYNPSRTYELFERLNPKVLIDDFNNIPEGEKEGIYSLSKFMEVFKNVYYFADNKEKKDRVVNFVKEILDGCSEEFLRRFEQRDAFFTQLHWFLKRLDGMKLGNYFLEKIPPAKIVEWIRTKDVRINELRFVFKNARLTRVQTDGTEEHFYSYFRNSLNYEDAKRVFANKRSKLYDIAITSKFSHEILANSLHRYSSEESFAQKVLAENNLYIINEAISLVETNPGLSSEQKNFIIRKIIGNITFSERLFKGTIKKARKIGKEIDIDSEKERFSNYKEKYGKDFA